MLTRITRVVTNATMTNRALAHLAFGPSLLAGAVSISASIPG